MTRARRKACAERQGGGTGASASVVGLPEPQGWHTGGPGQGSRERSAAPRLYHEPSPPAVEEACIGGRRAPRAVLRGARMHSFCGLGRSKRETGGEARARHPGEGKRWRAGAVPAATARRRWGARAQGGPCWVQTCGQVGGGLGLRRAAGGARPCRRYARRLRRKGAQRPASGESTSVAPRTAVAVFFAALAHVPPCFDERAQAHVRGLAHWQARQTTRAQRWSDSRVYVVGAGVQREGGCQ